MGDLRISRGEGRSDGGGDEMFALVGWLVWETYDWLLVVCCTWEKFDTKVVGGKIMQIAGQTIRVIR